jgi:outer membrane protein assembly factor BamB
MTKSRAFARGCALVGIGIAQVQLGLGDWMTGGNDAQRSSWIRFDTKISKESLQRPGFELLWKIKVDPAAKQSFAPPVLLNSYIGYRGFRSLAFVGVSSNKVIGIDTDLGKIEWRQQLQAGAPSSPCSGAMTPLTRPTAAAFPPPADRSGPGRGTPARTEVGESGEGSPVMQRQLAARAAAAKQTTSPARRPTGPPQPPQGLLHTIASDGTLHTIYVSNGEASPKNPAVPFLPPNSSAQGLIVIDNVAYAAAAPGCGAAADVVAAVDLATKELTTWKPDSGGIAGTSGPAIGPDGTLYVATTGGELIALEAKTLKIKSAYKGGQPFSSSPVIFQWKDKVLIVAATDDARIHILDSKDSSYSVSYGQLPGSIPSGPYSSLATYQSLDGTSWIIGADSHSVTALRVGEKNGVPEPQPGWTSREIAGPVAPIIVNGVVFTASTGTAPGVLCALDAATGKELWNSGKSITAPIRGGGLSSGNNQVFIGTSDGTFYAFGFPIEH